MTLVTVEIKNLMIPMTVPLDVQSSGLVMVFVIHPVRLTNANKMAMTVMNQKQAVNVHLDVQTPLSAMAGAMIHA